MSNTVQGLLDGQFTLGIEEEFQIVHAETRELRSYVSQMLEEGRQNAILRERCEANGIAYADGILAISSDAATDPTLVASDGLHPSGTQYRRWVIERIEPVVRSLLAAP